MRRVTGVVVLVGVALSAVTGCVTVHGEGGPARSPGEPGPRVEGGRQEDPAARPRPTRPPAREEPSRPRTAPSRTAEPGRRPAPPADGGQLPGAGESAAGAASPAAPEQPESAPRSPATPRLPGGAGLCDLGRRYGGWEEGGMPEQACERAYAD